MLALEPEVSRIRLRDSLIERYQELAPLRAHPERREVGTQTEDRDATPLLEPCPEPSAPPSPEEGVAWNFSVLWIPRIFLQLVISGIGAVFGVLRLLCHCRDSRRQLREVTISLLKTYGPRSLAESLVTQIGTLLQLTDYLYSE